MFESEIKIIKEALLKQNKTLEIVSEIKSGKEATVFLVKLDGILMALKLYFTNSILKNQNVYVSNKFYKTKSHKKAVASKNKFSKTLVKNNWIQREFSLLQKLYTENASVPKPILQLENGIFMEFLGNPQESAPRLQDVVLDPISAQLAFDEILRNIQIFLKVGTIHGDLSAYNILWWQDKIWIIDFPQAIDIRQNPQKQEFLIRDLQNICSYFNQYFKVDFEGLKNQFDLLNQEAEDIDSRMEL